MITLTVYLFYLLASTTLQLHAVSRFWPLRFNVIRFIHLVLAACNGVTSLIVPQARGGKAAVVSDQDIPLPGTIGY